MSTFENLSAQIGAGTITAAEIAGYVCDDLTSDQKVALLTALAAKLAGENIPSKLASVQSGIYEGDGGVVVVPEFLTGRIQMVDTDGSATPTLTGTHQFVTDTLGDSHPEQSLTEWSSIDGYHHAGRTFTVPAGITMLFTFILKD